MARVTVEDCLQNVKNRFELVMLASKRARQLMRGSSEPKVAWENDKATVVALREIAMGYTDFSDAHHADMVPRAQEATIEVIEVIDIMAENSPENESDSEEPTAQPQADDENEKDDSSEVSTTGNPAESE